MNGRIFRSKGARPERGLGSLAVDSLNRHDHQTRERILAFIETCQWSPTVREIGRAVGLTSPASVHRQLLELEREGLIGYAGQRIYPTNRRSL